MHPALEHTDHRPWAIPETRWVMRQSWCDLLFAHWPVPAASLRHLVPEPLQIQEHGGTSWVGVVPFRMQGVMVRPLPDLPYFSAFPELNLRLYVEYQGRPGVWFLSLDATNLFAVWTARKLFHLPYRHARMSLRENSGEFTYESVRLGEPSGLELRAKYKPVSDVYQSKPGSLEHWLTERYCLYSQSPQGRLYRAEIHHQPWPLQQCEAEFTSNELMRPHGMTLEGPPSLLHFSRRADVVVWPPKAVSV